ncbi:uncharacterized protein LOC131167519 [Malania oleifera]|uniref:uncharacterized protein LOC131167519 n=1 Tax=Malania oleifera TaxID=397392 RepID=UPI0025ADDD29|nr:uncharacterized protein LOC131167519 [Malania oleifera]
MNARSSPNNDGWVLDSGSSVHVCFKKDFFYSFKEVHDTVSLNDGSSCDVKGIGSMKLKTPVEVVHILDDVNFVPKMQRNLISLSRLDSKGCQITVGTKAISWMSQIQKIVALSTTEVEYVAVIEANKEMIWLQDLLTKLLNKAGEEYFAQRQLEYDTTSKELYISFQNQTH